MQKENSDIITIENIEEYSWTIKNGNLVLTKIVPTITEQSLFQHDLRGSKIIECKINNELVPIDRYYKLLIYLYSKTTKEIILQKTTLNTSSEKLYVKGFVYCEKIGLSFQRADVIKTLKNIINIVKTKTDKFELKILLKNKEIIKFML